MNTTEIIFLILGIVIFAASFIIPEKKAQINKEDIRLSETMIKELLEKEFSGIPSKLQDLMDETIEHSNEKTERALERLSNEKIMAVNEYSDTVLEEINKNHQEVMFLYDMLHEKHKNLIEMSQKVEKMAKNSEAAVNRAAETAGKVKTSVLKMIHRVEEEADRRILESNEDIENQRTLETGSLDYVNETEMSTETEGANTRSKESAASEQVKAENGRNNNERILALYKAGKSKVEIAKELGLGVGEVKLVIDLYISMDKGA